jgi:spermatogenesis-associated protein 2
MYSGFYQHEIKANLLNAEKMFIAMGYKLLPNQTMVLEDPICPDQVTNVSRDAMACKVECEIMKYVNSELTAMQLPTNWLEIFNYRERHVGKFMACHIRRLRI